MMRMTDIFKLIYSLEENLLPSGWHIQLAVAVIKISVKSWRLHPRDFGISWGELEAYRCRGVALAFADSGLAKQPVQEPPKKSAKKSFRKAVAKIA